MRGLHMSVDTLVALQLVLRVMRYVRVDETFSAWHQQILGLLLHYVKELQARLDELTNRSALMVLDEEKEPMVTAMRCLRAAWDHAAVIFGFHDSPQAERYLASSYMESRKKVFDVRILLLLW